MPLYIRSDEVAALVGKLAALKGYTKQEAVRIAVQAELDKSEKVIPLRERLAAWRAAHPMPPAAGQLADKAFFDDLSDEP